MLILLHQSAPESAIIGGGGGCCCFWCCETRTANYVEFSIQMYPNQFAKARYRCVAFSEMGPRRRRSTKKSCTISQKLMKREMDRQQKCCSPATQGLGRLAIAGADAGGPASSRITTPPQGCGDAAVVVAGRRKWHTRDEKIQIISTSLVLCSSARRITHPVDVGSSVLDEARFRSCSSWWWRPIPFQRHRLEL